MLILEVHASSLLYHLTYLPEFIHVQLSDEGRQVLVAKEIRENLFLEFFGIFDKNFIAVPHEVLVILGLLGRER